MVMQRKTYEGRMCFSIEMTKEANYLENRFDATSLKSHFEKFDKIFSLQEILPPLEFHALLGNPTAQGLYQAF